ncbi:hypothetical protein [Mycobacterium sp. Marseille-P9652]|uniref:hypothetical protein n=1 Tax=Mycobacterium sp. Marseille-P9652 TaxID=2654950 RepID=UPI0012E85F71|nr:hypothetical protein [Mycobacterium sp. Marseille-P9652]
MSRSNASSGGGLGALLAVAVVTWIVVKLIWLIAGVAALVGIFFLARAIARDVRRRNELRAAHRAAVRLRADQQHNWVLRGDDRGVYGPEGAELMHYLYPVQGQVRRLNRRE